MHAECLQRSFVHSLRIDCRGRKSPSLHTDGLHLLYKKVLRIHSENMMPIVLLGTETTVLLQAGSSNAANMYSDVLHRKIISFTRDDLPRRNSVSYHTL